LRSLCSILGLAAVLWFALFLASKAVATQNTESAQIHGRLWEPLTDDQIATVKNEAKVASGAHSFRIIYNCTDNCRDVVDGISSALRQAAWKEDFKPTSAPSWDLGRGIWIDQVKNDGGADALIAGLKDVHLPAERKPMGGTEGSPLIVIYVGDRPTP
jgi:hypothetical protein